MAPVMPVTRSSTIPVASARRGPARNEGRVPNDAAEAVNVSAPSKKNVLVRCSAIDTARRIEASSSTRRKSTSAAPISGFTEHERERHEGGTHEARLLAAEARRPDRHADHHEQRDAAGDPVGIFDERLGRCEGRQDLPVALRPMLSTACTGHRAPHDRAPEHHGHVGCEHGPGVASELRHESARTASTGVSARGGDVAKRLGRLLLLAGRRMFSQLPCESCFESFVLSLLVAPSLRSRSARPRAPKSRR